MNTNPPSGDLSPDSYCEEHTSQPDDSIKAVYRSTALHTANPHMASTPYQGMLLQILASLVHPRVAVEIGTHAGYGAVCLARGMGAHGTLHLVEANEEYEETILNHAKLAGVSRQVSLHIGQASEIIPLLPNGIDLAFVDADKENYPQYYSMLLPKMNKGGILLFDNMLWYGRVLTEGGDRHEAHSQLRRDRDTRVIDSLNKTITSDPRVENILLPIRDGIMLCRVK